jgi:hypothetical protein
MLISTGQRLAQVPQLTQYHQVGSPRAASFIPERISAINFLGPPTSFDVMGHPPLHLPHCRHSSRFCPLSRITCFKNSLSEGLPLNVNIAFPLVTGDW